ncbi:DUF3488 and transglutaminase-like domain-containing protein [soil metagenome]
MTTTRLGVAAAVAVLLAASALEPVFVNWDWLVPTVLAVLTVAAVGILTRRARSLAALTPVFQLGGLALFVNVYFAATNSFAGVLPTWTSLRDLRELLGDGGYAIRTQVSPAQTLEELLLVAALGVGAIAIAVDTTAVGLRRPAISGLPLLVLYAVPTAAVIDGVPWWPFAAGAAGYLILLFVESRESLLRWGRTVKDDRGRQPQLGVLSSQRIGALAIAAGVLLPLLVPTLPQGILRGTGAGIGDGPGTSLNPLAQLSGELTLPQPRQLLRVETSVEDPFYLRAVSLESYTDQGWTVGNLDEGFAATDSGLPGAPEGSPTRRIETEVEVLDHDDRFLPTYYATRQVQIAGNWRYDPISGTTFNPDETSGGRAYAFIADEPRPSAEKLAAAPDLGSEDQVQRRYTRLPALIRPEIATLVRQIVGDAAGPFARATAINDFFTDRENGFIYSLSTKPGTSGDDLVDFLTNRQGYCEQYAAAMAVMLRFVDVPARVVIGYTPGTINAGEWTVTSDDAHAWVEAYFQDIGWVPFDPTPLGGGRAVELPYAPRADSTPDAPEATATATAVGPDGQAPRVLLEEELFGTPGPGQDNPQAGAIDPWTTLTMLGTVLLIGVLAAPGVARLRSRRRRLRTAARLAAPVAAAHAAWDEIMATAADLGATPVRAETPRGTARRLARDHGFDEVTARAVRLLATAEERARYAPSGLVGVEGDLRAATRTVSRGIRVVSGRRERLRAVLAPASTLAAARDGLATLRLRSPALRLR